MTTEKIFYYTPEGESAHSIHNMTQLKEDFPDLLEKDFNGDSINIYLERFPSDDRGDHTYVSYSSHEGYPRNTLRFFLYDKFLEKNIEKGLSYSTLIETATKDSESFAIIKGSVRLSLKKVSKGGFSLSVDLINREDSGVVINLEPTEHAGYAWFNKGSVDPEMWETIKETIFKGLGYYITDLETNYEIDESELDLTMDLE